MKRQITLLSHMIPALSVFDKLAPEVVIGVLDPRAKPGKACAPEEKPNAMAIFRTPGQNFPKMLAKLRQSNHLVDHTGYAVLFNKAHALKVKEELMNWVENPDAVDEAFSKFFPKEDVDNSNIVCKGPGK